MPETLDSLVEDIMDLAREHSIDDARIYIKDRIEKDVIKSYVAALKTARETIRAFNGLGMTGQTEQACWDAYQHSPEMKQIDAAIDHLRGAKKSTDMDEEQDMNYHGRHMERRSHSRLD